MHDLQRERTTQDGRASRNTQSALSARNDARSAQSTRAQSERSQAQRRQVTARQTQRQQAQPRQTQSRQARPRQDNVHQERQRTRKPTARRTNTQSSAKPAAPAQVLPQALDMARSIPPIVFMGIAAAVVVLIVIVVASRGCASSGQPSGQSAPAAALSSKIEGATETTDEHGIVHGTTANGIRYVTYGRGENTMSGDANRVTLSAIGDVFATEYNLPILDRYAGEQGDDKYDFTPYYQATGDEIRKYDLRFVNQETVTAGENNGWAYNGWPTFNTPESSIRTIANEKFNVVNFNSNHTWDLGEFGIERSHGVFAESPEVMVVGSYKSDEDRATVRLIERGGHSIAFLSYCYGDNSNGTNMADFPNQYYSCEFDKDTMRREIQNAQEIADAVVVYMHWGTEYETEPNAQQMEYAEFLSDLGVDLVIGSHAHILQPIRYVTGSAGNTTPVVFGLSDWITGWLKTDTILSGMFTCDFVWGNDNGKVSVENLQFYPAIEWSNSEDEYGETYVRFLKDMSDEEIAANTRTADVAKEDIVKHLHTFLDDLHMEVPVIW